MNKEIHSGIMLTLLLICMLTLAFKIQPAKASGTIYIRADGSIDPPTAPVFTVDNVSYTFTDNIYDDILIERDNIVVDGGGYILQGTGSGTGINLTGRNNVMIKNMEVKAFSYGIYLYFSSNNTIRQNNIADNRLSGISLHKSSTNSISENHITANYFNGVFLSRSSDYNNIIGNDITNTDWWGVRLYSSSHNKIHRNNITLNGVENQGDGLQLYGSSNHNRIFENNIVGNFRGIRLLDSPDNSLYHNNLRNSKQAYSMNGMNVWDDGYPSGGNYWSNHVTVDNYSGINQDEPGSDGIVDEPYLIDNDNQDNYPLMEPYSPPPRTIDELKTEIEELGSDGGIDNLGVVRSLLAKLNAAQKLVDKGKADEAKSILKDDFIPQVQNLTDIHITKEAAELLIQSVGYILSNL